MMIEYLLHLVRSYRDVRHREASHDDDNLRVVDLNRVANLHSRINDRNDLFCPTLVHEGDEYLRKMKIPDCEAKKFNKRGTCSRHSVIHDLAPCINLRSLNIRFKWAKYPGDSLKCLFFDHGSFISP